MTIVSLVEQVAFTQTPALGGPPPARFMPLADLWGILTSGSGVLVDCIYSEQRCFATVQTARGSGLGHSYPKKRLMILERVLLGESQKSVAYDLGVVISTIASSCKDALAVMGESRPASRAFVLLSMAAHAARGFRLNSARFASGEVPAAECWTISAQRPDFNLPTCLTEKEQLVLRLSVEGRSHLEIAKLREVSARTVANQLCSVFRKLNVSGRAELLAYLIRREWERE